MSPNSIYIVVSSIFVLVIGLDVYNWMRGRKFDAPHMRIQRFLDKINYTVLIFGTMFLIASILFHVNLLHYRPPIEYGQINSITLKDFKGYKLPNHTLDGTNEFAFITTSIDWTSGNQSVTVRALFHPARSYVFNENTGDKYLLTHELYHFRVTEIFARRVRERLTAFGKKPDDAEIKYVISNNESLERIMQNQYDDETYHGYVFKKQRSWQIKIDSLLSLLDKLKETSVRYPHHNE